MTITTAPELFVDASPSNPALIVVQNLGAAATPNLYIGEDQTSLELHGLQIAPGGASPQITVTKPYYIVCDTTGGSTQSARINVNRVAQ